MMSAASAALVAAATATIIRPDIPAWGAHAASIVQAEILAEMARAEHVRAYLDKRRLRRARPEAEQFAFDFMASRQ